MDHTKTDGKKNIGRAFVIMLLPVLLYGITGPVEIYVSNLAEFNFRLMDFWWMLALLWLGIWVTASLVLAFLPARIRTWAEGFVTGISVLSYLQNMFLNRELIRQDGTRMDWAALKGYSTVNLIVWVVVFALFLSLPFLVKSFRGGSKTGGSEEKSPKGTEEGKTSGFQGAETGRMSGAEAIAAERKTEAGRELSSKIYFGISAFLSALQLVAFLSILFRALSVNYEEGHYALDGAEQYKVSSGRNVIVFVLDHYSNGIFENCLEEKTGIAEGLRDFTYYDNADSHYSYTFPSLAHMLTGEDVDLNMTPEAWEQEIWTRERCRDFYRMLHENGYACHFFSDGGVYSVLGNIGYLQGSFDNVIETEPKIDHALLARLFQKMTIYRNVPYILKPKFETLTATFQAASSYVVENGVQYGNVAFYDKLRNEGLSVSAGADNRYIVMHLEGVHGPRTMKADATYTDLGLYYDDEEPTEEETAQGLSVLLNEYLAQLKDIGVYDSAAIIITADHGDEKDPQPIFFLKQPGERHGEMQISSAPISHDDLPATVLTLAGLDGSAYGKSVMEFQDGEKRPRQSYFPSEGFRIYEYETDKTELMQKMENEEYTVGGVETGWKHSW